MYIVIVLKQNFLFLSQTEPLFSSIDMGLHDEPLSLYL